jgi:hypothetical protein
MVRELLLTCMLTGARLAARSGALGGAVLLADWAVCQPLKPVLGCGWPFPACACG